MRRLRQHRGFTLVELLLVIGIIAILSGLTLAAISPTKQLASSRDAKRQTDILAIMNGLHQYALDHNSNFPTGIPQGTAKEICTVKGVACGDLVDLSGLSGTYLVLIPSDPREPQNSTGTNYFIVENARDEITITAPGAERSSSISLTR